jgi:ATP-dependent 26S proteasome regulatory subunit
MAGMNTPRSRDIKGIWSKSVDQPCQSALTICRYIQLQEEYIKDEQRLGYSNCIGSVTDSSGRSLKRELVRAQEEIKRIQSVPLVIGQFMEAIDQK